MESRPSNFAVEIASLSPGRSDPTAGWVEDGREARAEAKTWILNDFWMKETEVFYWNNAI